MDSVRLCLYPEREGEELVMYHWKPEDTAGLKEALANWSLTAYNVDGSQTKLTNGAYSISITNRKGWQPLIELSGRQEDVSDHIEVPYVLVEITAPNGEREKLTDVVEAAITDLCRQSFTHPDVDLREPQYASLSPDER